MATDIRRGYEPTIEFAVRVFEACKEALASNSEALAQPAQEPVTKVFDGAEYDYVGSIKNEYGEASLFYKVINPAPTIKESLNVEQPAQEPYGIYHVGQFKI